MNIVGGLRDRLIDESIYHHVKSGLGGLGWFDSDRRHKPLDFLSTTVGDDDQIVPNTVVMSSEFADADVAELGSSGTFNVFDVWFDLYCESDALGKQLCGDIQALLLGQLPYYGFDKPVVPVFDWSQATPPVVFLVDVLSVERQKNRARNVAKPQDRHMWTMLCVVEDARV